MRDSGGPGRGGKAVIYLGLRYEWGDHTPPPRPGRVVAVIGQRRITTDGEK